MARLSGKKALIVGAAGKGNMGQNIARRFAAEGASVTVSGRNMKELQLLADEIGGHAVYGDMSNRKSVFTMVEQAKSAMGGLDIAVNSTGSGQLTPFLEITDDELDKIYALQLRGVFQFIQALIPAMEDSGSIIQISSATATILFHDHYSYMATKAGADHLIRAIANEFGERGIRANSISPGVTETPMTQDAQQVPGLMDAFVSCYPLGRYGTTDDIGAACVFLASDECFMTGENLHVSGGLRLRRNPNQNEIEQSIAASAQQNS